MQSDEDITKQGQVKPISVVINTSQNEKTLDVNPLTNSASVPGIQNTTVSTLKQTRRIQLASIVVFVSMFFNWGYTYWLKWAVDWPRKRGIDGGWWDESYKNLWDYMEDGNFSSPTASAEVGFAEMQSFFFRFQIWGDVADLAGPSFALFMLRELTPFVFIGTLVFCWINRAKGDEFFRKVTMFYGGYFLLIAVQTFYISVQLSESIDWRFNVLFDCFGFMLAGVACLILDPKIIPLPESIYSRKETFNPGLNQTGTNTILNNTLIIHEEAINYGVLALFYFPLLYHFFTVISVFDGGNDDALFLGITLPIVGLLIGIRVYRLEFLKGFGMHLVYSTGYGGMAFFVAITDIFSEVEDFFLPAFMVAVIVPLWYHLQSKHTKGLGATYAIPFTFWMMILGFVIGWFLNQPW